MSNKIRFILLVFGHVFATRAVYMDDDDDDEFRQSARLTLRSAKIVKRPIAAAQIRFWLSAIYLNCFDFLPV